VEEHAMKSLVKTQCSDRYRLFQYFIGDLNAQDSRSIENHLAECDECLLKIQEFALIQSRLNAVPDSIVPEELIEQVSGQWKKSEADEPVIARAIPLLVVQFVRNGLQVLKESILPVDMEIRLRPLAEPAHFFRENGASEGSLELLLEQEIQKQNILLSLSLIREPHESVRLRVHLKESNKSLPKTRVSLKQNGSILHSKKTSSEGMVTFFELHPGSYTVQVPSRKIEWTIEIRS
jgi:hypothetical protein